MMTRLTTLFAASMFLFYVSLPAQIAPPPGPLPGEPENHPNPVQAAQRILNLTETQVDQLLELRKSFMETGQNGRIALRDLQQQIATLLNSTDPDPAQIGTLEIQRRNLERRLQAVNQSYHQSAIAVLTQEQKDKVAQIERAIRLAPQAMPLGALGLLEGPPMGRDHFFVRGGMGPAAMGMFHMRLPPPGE